ncbi:hypothetical protein QQ008_07145 [Fulvivirgaceae bacterium BMA10]|uniref:LemA family protein n=1 Tax=Splendidivirga corallicola TaxID=3051826 RepID=A0ABT8KK94_9BACT|nr:hypothetical protein [Fulvivirgaceae bacterium BMA10]
MRYISGCFILFIGVLCISSCGKKNNTSKAQDEFLADSLRAYINQLNDSIEYAWQVMIEDDDEKISTMKRLLDEVSYTNSYNKETFDSLTAGLEKLRSTRYDINSMIDSKKIDEYDLSANELSNAVIQFAHDHPKFEEYGQMEEFIQEIIDANDRVFHMRNKYDDAASAYNQFIKENRKILSRFNIEASEKPLFALPF